MTVAELIAKLQEMPGDALVLVRRDFDNDWYYENALVSQVHVDTIPLAGGAYDLNTNVPPRGAPAVVFES